jgi:hypothetical protein
MISSTRNHARRCYRVSLEGLVDEELKPRNRNRSDVELDEGLGCKLLDVTERDRKPKAVKTVAQVGMGEAVQTPCHRTGKSHTSFLS